MSRLFALPASRRATWVVLGTWILVVLGSSAADLSSRFTDAQENESTSFLPADAESTKALAITEQLNRGDVAPTVVVYRRAAGLTTEDRARIKQDVADLNTVTRRFSNTTRFENPEGADAVEPSLVSFDGTTALIINDVRGTGEAEDILGPVNAYRAAVSATGDAPAGLQVKVTGPAGISADAVKVFQSIDGRLLGGAFLLVIVLLILIYRSPIFWLFPIIAVVVAEIAARSVGMGLSELGVTITGQSSSILSILVIGAGTDYALLLVARYREELRRHEDERQAMAIALRRAGPAILASGLTVMAALLSLTLADVNGTAGIGPTGAAGVFVAMVVMLTFLPALLVVVGRRPFWPGVPQVGDEGADETHGRWRRIGELVERRPRHVALGSAAALVLMALGLLNFSDGLTQASSFREGVESIEGQKLIEKAFPGGRSAPTDIVLPPAAQPTADDERTGVRGFRAAGVRDRAVLAAVVSAAAGVPGVASVTQSPVHTGPAGTQLAAFLQVDPYSSAAFDIVPALREAVRRVEPGALVGGPSAVGHDLRRAASSDTRLLIPLALLIVLVILGILLRAVLAPVMLVLTVVLSFLAALGAGAVVFDVVFDFPGSDPTLPLFSFIFLVALGVDYNIFLMARVREEALAHGTHQGMLRGLAVTGGVITSAGLVLAGTFAVLGVLPLVFLTQLGFVIAFGVLLDTFIVRSLLVPALVFELGPRIWWPSALAKAVDDRRATPRPLRRPRRRATGGNIEEAASAPDETLLRLTSTDYERMVELGAIDGQTVELLDGLLVEQRPQGPDHRAVVHALASLFAPLGERVIVQSPLGAGDHSRPRPDLTLVGADDAGQITAQTRLVVEVVVSARQAARRKARIYAAAGIPELWIVDVPRRVVEVLDEPEAGAYERTRRLHGDDVLPGGDEGIAMTPGAIFAQAGLSPAPESAG